MLGRILGKDPLGLQIMTVRPTSRYLMKIFDELGYHYTSWVTLVVDSYLLLVLERQSLVYLLTV